MGFKKAFAVLNLEFESLFNLQTVSNIKVPEYAPSHDSYICTKCGESTMATRTIEKSGKIVCMECAGKAINQLTGSGINSD